VPTRADFAALDVALGGSGINRKDAPNGWIADNYVAKWGAVFGGSGQSDYIEEAGTRALYWGSEIENAYRAWGLWVNTPKVVYPAATWPFGTGAQIRCVR
jgi:hypothetical protein